MREVLKRPQAERDIEECFVFIGEQNIDAAFRFLEAIEASFAILSRHPLIGTSRDFGNPELKNLRMWIVSGFEKYEIFYFVAGFY